MNETVLMWAFVGCLGLLAVLLVVKAFLDLVQSVMVMLHNWTCEPHERIKTNWRGLPRDMTNDVKVLKAEITRMNEVLRQKNLELDALHFVWCDGGCQAGVHRFDHGELTEEIVIEAERNTKRLRNWFENKRDD